MLRGVPGPSLTGTLRISSDIRIPHSGSVLIFNSACSAYLGHLCVILSSRQINPEIIEYAEYAENAVELRHHSHSSGLLFSFQL